jgi:hypothetical protein
MAAGDEVRKYIMNGFLKQVSLWIVLLIIVVLALSNFSSMKAPKRELLEPDFIAQLQKGNIKSVQAKEVGNKLIQVVAELKDEVAGKEEVGEDAVQHGRVQAGMEGRARTSGD